MWTTVIVTARNNAILRFNMLVAIRGDIYCLYDARMAHFSAASRHKNNNAPIRWSRLAISRRYIARVSRLDYREMLNRAKRVFSTNQIRPGDWTAQESRKTTAGLITAMWVGSGRRLECSARHSL